MEDQFEAALSEDFCRPSTPWALHFENVTTVAEFRAAIAKSRETYRRQERERLAGEPFQRLVGQLDDRPNGRTDSSKT